METPDYLAYKKNKEKYKIENSKMPKIKLFFWIFAITFFGAFIGVKILAGQYTSKIDIEEEKNLRKNDFTYAQNEEEGRKYSIDRRLTNIYNEEIAPSKARVIEKSDDPSVIDLRSYREMVSAKEKEEARETQKEEVPVPEKVQIPDEKVALAPKITLNTPAPEPKAEVPVYIRIFVGRYRTLEEAREAQGNINDIPQFSAISPFIRKIGEVYTIQVGSYTNKQVAKSTALKFGNAGYNVWMIEN